MIYGVLLELPTEMVRADCGTGLTDNSTSVDTAAEN